MEEQKLITFTIPCYNSEAYMRKCIDSILPMGERAEIIVIDDGSKDGTGAIADEYAEKYPTIVKAVHQENGGHGEGINQGLARANGIYFRVVDSDDWLDEAALKELENTILKCQEEDDLPDLIITNFVYEKLSENTRYVSSYEKNFPIGKCTWDDVKPFKLWHVLLMHALTYKTSLLRETGIVLPKHTFYEDNVFAYVPLAKTRKLYYLNVDLYRYFIGREGQSVTMNNIVKNYKHQLRDMDCILKAYTYEEICALPKNLQKYMKHFIKSIMANTIYFTCGAVSDERKRDFKEFWDNLKERDEKLYRYMRRHGYAAILMPMPWRLRGWVAKQGYVALCKIVKLG